MVVAGFAYGVIVRRTNDRVLEALSRSYGIDKLFLNAHEIFSHERSDFTKNYEALNVEDCGTQEELDINNGDLVFYIRSTFHDLTSGEAYDIGAWAAEAMEVNALDKLYIENFCKVFEIYATPGWVAWATDSND